MTSTQSKQGTSTAMLGEGLSSLAGGQRVPKLPSEHWLWGNVPEFRAGILPFFERCRREYGTVVAFRLGPRRCILVSEPDLIQEVVGTQNRHFRKHFAVRLLKPALGNGLLLSEGKVWLQNRRFIQPAFARPFLSFFEAIVRRRTEELAEQWDNAPDRDLYQDMTRLTVQIAAEGFLGGDCRGDLDEIAEALETIHADFEQRLQSAFPLPIWLPGRKNRIAKQAVEALRNVIHRIMKQRESCRESSDDALSLLLKARDPMGNPMPRRQIRDELMTLLLAGHDTTANALSWSWYLLAQHPQESEYLAQGSVDLRSMDYESLLEGVALSRAGMVLQESMRLFPPVYVFGREAIRDVQLEGLKVRRGETLMLCQWLVHRDERYFDDPNAFIPSRWTAEFQQSLPPYSYFPFGGGPRICIGKDFAMVEGACVLQILGAKFSIELATPQDIKPWPTVTLRPNGPMCATVRRRSNNANRSGE